MSKILLVLLFFILSSVLFYIAAGTLHPGKLNIVSCVYYIFMLQYFIGAALLVLGFDGHYTLTYLYFREQSIQKTIISIMIVSVAMPILIILWQKIFRINITAEYCLFLRKKTNPSKMDIWWKLFILGMVMCILFLVAYLLKVGYIPILKLVHAPEGFNFASERTRIATTYFLNSYVNNIVLFTIVPLMSYISFAYALATKEKKWYVIFIIMFAMSIICKTYKFEKTPVLFHMMIFVLIFIYLKGTIKFRYMAVMGCMAVVFLVVIYVALGYEGTFLDIYNGPMGRTFFTEVGTLSYCFDMIPNIFDYLGGRSFSPTVLKILGINAESHLRSAKLTMAFYGSEKVYDGTAGVMNTLFIGEAYANWGYKGIVISILWVTLIIAILMWIIFKLKKSPSIVVLLAVLSVRIAMTIKGGFCDFVYNFDLLFTVCSLLLVYAVFEGDGWLNQKSCLVIEKIKGKLKNDKKIKR